jgi:hypothetical protein
MQNATNFAGGMIMIKHCVRLYQLLTDGTAIRLILENI